MKVVKSFIAWLASTFAMNACVALMCVMYNLNMTNEAKVLTIAISALFGVVIFFVMPYLDGYFSREEPKTYKGRGLYEYID